MDGETFYNSVKNIIDKQIPNKCKCPRCHTDTGELIDQKRKQEIFHSILGLTETHGILHKLFNSNHDPNYFRYKCTKCKMKFNQNITKL